jgi:hypothetical protein
MEHNSSRLIDLLEELRTLTWQKSIPWQALDGDASYQYQGPRAAVIISSQGDSGEGPYVMSVRDSSGEETGALTEAAEEGRERPASWNSSLAYLYALAKRSASSSPASLMSDLDLPPAR